MKASERVALPETTVQMTKMGLGSVAIAGLYTDVPDATARNTVLRAVERGVGFFDTAPLYGLGMAERRVGDALHDVPRSEFVLSTKVGRLLRSGEAAKNSSLERDYSHLHSGESMFKGIGEEQLFWDFSYDGVMRSIEESLERLQMSRVDMVFVHDPEEHMDVAVTETMPALVELRDQGVIGAVGVGLDFESVGMRFVQETDVNCLLVAGRCTLLDRSAVPELFPLCEQRGVSVIAASVFNSGLLADPIRNSNYWYEPADAAVLAKAISMSDACDRYGVPLRAAALQYPYRFAPVVSVLVGAASPAQVDDNVDNLEINIPEALWQELDELSAE